MKPLDADLPRAELLNVLLRPPPARRGLVMQLSALGSIMRTRFVFV